MEQTLIDQITCRLARFDEAIRNAERPDGTGTDAGRVRASSPFLEQHRVRSLLDGCKDHEPGVASAVAEFDRLSGRLSLLRQNRPGYRDALLEELRYFLGSYHAELCWQATGAAFNPESGSAREIVLILMEELRDEYDLRDIEELMESLNDAGCRVDAIPEKSPRSPPVPCPTPGEISLWRDDSGIREE